MDFVFSQDVIQRSTYPNEPKLVHYQKKPRVPEWYGFFLDLVKPSNTANQDAVITLSQVEPYAFVFKNAVSRFHDAILDYTSPHIFLNKEVFNTISEWYVARLLEQSKYVLHVAFISSKLTYSKWCDSFNEQDQASNPWAAIAEEYPILLRSLFEINFQCIDTIQEIFQRLKEDRYLLTVELGLALESNLCAISLGLSDPHRQGRTVVIFQFDCGKSIVYKPKCLLIDQKLYNFLTQHQNDFGVTPLAVLPRDGYGWVEHVRTIRNLEINQNPIVMGKATALFWLLNATDLHVENIFCDHRAVYSLDLETLLTPIINCTFEAEHLQWRNHSVFTTMLFDICYGERTGKNISGFIPSQNLGFLGTKIEFQKVNDTIVLKKVAQDSGSTNSESRLNDNSLEFTEQVIEGFESVVNSDAISYIKIFLKDLDENCTMRLVLRDTFFYSKILERMRQPRFMRSGELLYSDLRSLHTRAPKTDIKKGNFYTIVESEISQLLSWDIPYFSYSTKSCSLEAHELKISSLFEISGKENAFNKVTYFEKSDVLEQIELIRLAFNMQQQFVDTPSNSQMAELSHGEKVKQSSNAHLNLLKGAENLVSKAFKPSTSPARWISMFGDVSGHELKVGVGDNSFFGGSLGITMALQATQSIKGQPVDKTITSFLNFQSDMWSKKLSKSRHESAPNEEAVLGFSGIGGEVFAKSILLRLEPARWHFLKANIYQELLDVKNTIANDDWLDVIGGSAGLALGCEQYLLLEQFDETAELAKEVQVACAQHLMKRAVKTEHGLAWLAKDEDNALLGYAHGWSGVVNALSCVKRRVKSEEIKTSISTCLQQTSLFPIKHLEESGQWYDYRTGLKKDSALNGSWCNGVPGVLRGLLEIKEFWTEELSTQFELLLDGLKKNLGNKEELRFCCGEMGNIDLAIDLVRNTDYIDNNYMQQINFVAHTALARLIEYEGSNIPELTFPALFQGRAGIIYTAARLSNPDLPSLSGQNFYG